LEVVARRNRAFVPTYFGRVGGGCNDTSIIASFHLYRNSGV